MGEHSVRRNQCVVCASQFRRDRGRDSRRRHHTLVYQIAECGGELEQSRNPPDGSTVRQPGRRVVVCPVHPCDEGSCPAHFGGVQAAVQMSSRHPAVCRRVPAASIAMRQLRRDERTVAPGTGPRNGEVMSGREMCKPDLLGRQTIDTARYITHETELRVCAIMRTMREADLAEACAEQPGRSARQRESDARRTEHSGGNHAYLTIDLQGTRNVRDRPPV